MRPAPHEYESSEASKYWWKLAGVYSAVPLCQHTDISLRSAERRTLRASAPVKYATFSLPSDPSPRLGIVDGDRIIDAAKATAGKWPGEAPATLVALIQQGPDAWQRMREFVRGTGSADLSTDLSTVASYIPTGIRWHAPIPRPLKNVVCLGMNYLAHIREGAAARGREAKIPKAPVFFTKATTAVTGPFADIRVDPALTQQVDWEAELGLIIGTGGRDIRKEDALHHVFGYTVINDVSARDLQAQHFQFFKGKSLDDFCPMGPVVVTADEFGDPQNKRLLCRVNGVTKQDASTSDMIFSSDVIIESLSQSLTLEPGDIIATGTPEGVGFGRTPPEFLRDGDIVEAEVEGIGVIRNRVKYIGD
jgi:2-keto-4-pentenoate hydratase/2-oxohepta-3-ene-1,7-dioic acid hydratase in catechol pathway